MTTQSKVIIANLVGIFVLALGMWGIEVDSEQQAQIVAGLGAIGTVINMVIVAFRTPEQRIADEIAAAEADVKKNGGFVAIDLIKCMALGGLLMIAVFALSACTPHPMTPAHTVAATSLAIEKLAVQIDLAQKSGQISDEREDELLDTLAALNEHLRLAYGVTGPAQQQSLRSINESLIMLRAELVKEQAR